MPVIPSSGTFRVYPIATGLSLKTGDFQVGVPAGNCAANILAVASNAVIASGLSTISNADRIRVWQGFAAYCSPDCFGLFPVVGNYEIEISNNDHSVIFNPGGAEIIADFWTAGFPMGFLATALEVVWKGTALKSAISQDIINFNLRFNRSNVYTNANPSLSDVIVTSGVTSILPAGVYTGALNSIFSKIGFTFTTQALSLIGTTCGDIPSVQATFYTDYLYFQGNYILWSSSMSMTPNKGGPGTIVTVVDNIAPGVLDDITEILIYSGTEAEIETEVPIRIPIRSSYVYSWTPTQLVFQVPLDLRIRPGRRIRIAFEVVGTTFTGSIPMGFLFPTLTDGSGIYTLNKDKRSDTYYDRSGSPVTNVNVKMPTPYIKTGFFNAG